MNNISFQGNLCLTNYVGGSKKVSNYVIDADSDKIIKNATLKLFGCYNPNNFKVVKNDPEVVFRKLVGDIIGKDLKKKNYFDNSVLSFGPNNITFKEMNRFANDGIEFNIVF